MIKLKGYLKPYLHLVFFAVLLLFAQAFADLSLPRYMANIVNVGIQQRGIESGAPQVLLATDFEAVGAVLRGEEQENFSAAYRRLEPGEASSYARRFPAAAEETVYVLAAPGEAADKAYLAAVHRFIGLFAASGDGAATPGERSMDLGAILPALGALDDEKLAAAEAAGAQRGMGDSIAVAFTGGFYENLGVDFASFQQRYILKTGWIMLGLALLAGIASVFVGLLASRLAAAVAADLRRDMFHKVSSFSNAEYDRFSTASLITRTTNDITQIFVLITMGMRMFFYAPVMAVGGVTMAIRTSPSLSWVIALAVALLITLVLIVFSVALPRFKILQKLTDRLNLVSRENLTGLMVIRAFGNQEFEAKRYDEANEDLMRVHRFIGRVMSFMMPTMMFIMNGASLLIVWFGAKQIAASGMQVGDMMAFMQYTMQVIMSFLFLSMVFILVPRASVSAGRIWEVLSAAPSIVEAASPADFPQGRGQVEFRDVTFRYQGAEEDAVRGISFTARPGEMTAVIGPTGSGKSTLLQLLLRFYDVTAGAILVDGVDIRQLRRSELRDAIGYVPQKNALLSGTIGDNIAYGRKDAAEGEIHWAAEVAQAAEVIAEKDGGIHSAIAQGGANVSGGQKQRLAIARAILKRAKIYLFDDSFSALDFKTDSALRKALEPIMADRVMIVVAQRVSSIIKAEQIIVMDEGGIVGIGDHQALLENCAIYREIATSQLPAEDMA